MNVFHVHNSVLSGIWIPVQLRSQNHSLPSALDPSSTQESESLPPISPTVTCDAVSVVIGAQEDVSLTEQVH